MAVVLGGIVLGIGCNKTAIGTTGVPDLGAAATGGRALYEANCRRCHVVGAPTGGAGPMMKAPDLAKVGADPKHTREWIAAYIRDPKAQKPDSHMPPFGGKLNDADIGTLADYILSLKPN
jgi:mono/diheme cytochrome c family protein